MPSGPAHPPAAVREAEEHVRACTICQEKVRAYRRLVNRSTNQRMVPGGLGPECPGEGDVNWAEVAGGVWPELKAGQLIQHAAMCDHCGPLLGEAVRQRQTLYPEIGSTRWEASGRNQGSVFGGWQVTQFGRWVAGALTLIAVAAWWSAKPSRPPRPLSGPQIAELAVAIHRQHGNGSFPLVLRTDSRQALNAWLQSNSKVVVSTPVAAIPDDEPAYRLEGARLLPVGSQTAAYISYQASVPGTVPAAVSLMVTPDSMAVASDGVEVDFPKVSFHYITVDGYKVVSWSVHGMTYALVSEEDTKTQRACLVCHSSRRDPVFNRIPRLPVSQSKADAPVWQ